MRNIDKAGLLRNELLETLVEGEKRGYSASDKAGNAAVRTVCVEWYVPYRLSVDARHLLT